MKVILNFQFFGINNLTSSLKIGGKEKIFTRKVNKPGKEERKSRGVNLLN